MHKLSIIIPAYNEARTIEALIAKVKAVDLPAGEAGLGNVEKEIIVVDNGSTDETAQILKAVDGIRVLTLNPNRKKGGAVKAGIKEATGNIVIVQDADLEYDPNDYPAMIRPILDGKTEVTNGVRIQPEHDERKRKSLYWLSWLGNNVITWTTNWLYWHNAGEYEGRYKAFTKKLLNTIEVKTNDFDFDNELMCKILKRGIKPIDIPIRYYPRSYAEGKKINWRHGVKILKTIISTRFRR